MSSNESDRLFAEGDRAILEWTLSAVDYDQFHIEDYHTDADTVQILLSAMTAVREERDRAIDIIHLLVQERNDARSYMSAQSREAQQNYPLYRKVGLNENCPDFVLLAARTAYRKKFHPDGYPPAQRSEAGRKFQEAEVVFEEILRSRAAERPHR